MSKEELAKVKFVKQYLKDLSVENPNPSLFFGKNEDMNVNINYKLKQSKYSEIHHEINFECSIEITNKEKIKVYLLELVYGGLFEIRIENTNNSEEILKEVLFIKCAEIIFPFVRHLIETITHNSGIKPISLDLIDFYELYQNSRNN